VAGLARFTRAIVGHHRLRCAVAISGHDASAGIRGKRCLGDIAGRRADYGGLGADGCLCLFEQLLRYPAGNRGRPAGANPLKLNGILGGTFDPVHIGHVQLARDALSQLHLDALRCVPAGQPPHRTLPWACAQDRLAMVRLAFASEPGCFVDDAEIRQAGPSWTIQTLERLWQQEPDTAHVLILGADALLGLPSWRRWQELLNYAHIAVANRPGAALVPAFMPEPLRSFWADSFTADWSRLRQQRAGCLVSFNIAPCEVSATRVRQQRAQGLPVTGLLPAAVENYIQQHHLYTLTAC